MLSQQLRMVLISLPDLVSVDASLTLLKSGQGLTSAQSGVVAYDPIAQQTLIDQTLVFDGFNYTLALFVSQGG